MSQPNAVEVTIGGHRLVVSSEHTSEYTAAVALHFDAAFQRIRAAMPKVDAQRAAILAGLAVTDELFQARVTSAASAVRVQKVTEQLARLVPPEKRGDGG